MPDRADCAAVLTAAGLSSRMGAPKALLDWHGKKLIRHQLDALEGFGRIVVVTGCEAEKIRPHLLSPVVEAYNENYLSGRTSSLLCGFSKLSDCAAVLVCGIDQPMEQDLPDALLAELAAHSYAYPVFEKRRGHPLVFHGRLLPELLAIREESEGLRALSRKYFEESIAVPWSTPSVLLDLNSPRDLERGRKN